MMKHRLMIIGAIIAVVAFAVLFLVSAGEAQGAKTLSGTCIEGTTTAPIEGMVIEVRNPTTGVPLYNATTDEDGKFNISVAEATYTLFMDGENIFIDQSQSVNMASNVSVGTKSFVYTSPYESNYMTRVRFVNGTGAGIANVSWAIQDSRGAPTGAIHGLSDANGYAYVPYGGFETDSYSLDDKRMLVYSKNGYVPNSSFDEGSEWAQYVVNYEVDADGQPYNEGSVVLDGDEIVQYATHPGELLRHEVLSDVYYQQRLGFLLSSSYDDHYLTSVDFMVMTDPGYYEDDYHFNVTLTVYDDGLTKSSVAKTTTVHLIANDAQTATGLLMVNFEFSSPLYLNSTKDYFFEFKTVSGDWFWAVYSTSGEHQISDYDPYIHTEGAWSAFAGAYNLVLNGPKVELGGVEKQSVQEIELFEYSVPSISLEPENSEGYMTVNGTTWTMPVENAIDIISTFTFAEDAPEHDIVLFVQYKSGSGWTNITQGDTVVPGPGNTTFYDNYTNWHENDECTLHFKAWADSEYYVNQGLVEVEVVLYNTPPSVLISSIYSDYGSLELLEPHHYQMSSVDAISIQYYGADFETYITAYEYDIEYLYEGSWGANDTDFSSSIYTGLMFDSDEDSDPEIQQVFIRLKVSDSNGAWGETNLTVDVYNYQPTLNWSVSNVFNPLNQPYFNDEGVLMFPTGDIGEVFIFNFTGSTNADYEYDALAHGLHSFVAHDRWNFAWPVFNHHAVWVGDVPGEVAVLTIDPLFATGSEYAMCIGIADYTWGGPSYFFSLPSNLNFTNIVDFNFTVTYIPVIDWPLWIPELYHFQTGDKFAYGPDDMYSLADASASWDNEGDITYTWIFDMNNGEELDVYTTAVVDYEFPTDGICNITLIIEDEEGWRAQETRMVFVHNAPPTITLLEPLEFNYSGYGGAVAGSIDAYTIDGFNLNGEYIDIDGGTVQFYWDLGDGNTSTLIERNYSYGNDGIYLVKLIANGSYGMSYISFYVYAINTPPFAVCNDVRDDVLGANIAFDASGSYDTDGRVVSVYWEFGDGGSSNDTFTNHSYTAIGSYIVRLTVLDDDGNHDILLFRIIIKETPELIPQSDDIEQSATEGESVITTISLDVDNATATVTMFIDPLCEIYGLPFTYTVYNPEGDIVAQGTIETDNVTFPTNSSGEYTITFETSDMVAGNYTGRFMFVPTTQSGIDGEATPVNVHFAVDEGATTLEELIENPYFLGLVIIVLFVIAVVSISIYRKRQYAGNVQQQQMHVRRPSDWEKR